MRTPRVHWYWLGFTRGFRVTYHLQHDFTVRWDGVYGVQVGTWFIGIVHSKDEPGAEVWPAP